MKSGSRSTTLTGRMTALRKRRMATFLQQTTSTRIRNVCLTTWVKEFSRMHGPATTARCLPMDRQEAVKATRSLDSRTIKELYPYFAKNCSRK
ncbi:hypothetical protein OESDEN_03092 [Oesophagostomum dentatum]|uniref:Uncharacterized protein n=1 Tax=Oesophagostomum dentatum TaxID=61180 RepID=A0A0B1TLF1_OESDE|nr:hypothetical protein OESDEN_03092 [Oesophagostomum dentatum]